MNATSEEMAKGTRIVNGGLIARPLLEVFGLTDKRVTALTLRLAVNEPVKLTVERFIVDDEAANAIPAMRTIMESYHLECKKDE